MFGVKNKSEISRIYGFLFVVEGGVKRQVRDRVKEEALL